MTTGSTGSLETLRRLNRLRVIHTLREQGVTSRAEIARRTGLSRSTVSSLVADLQADGLVVERAEHGSARGTQGGRPPILLALDASAGAAVGIDFGHSHLRVAVTDLSPRSLAERPRDARRRPRGREGARRRRRARRRRCSPRPSVDRDRRDRRRHGPAGPDPPRHGTVGSSAILPGWVGVSGRPRSCATGSACPVAVDNDANLGALAEVALGAGRDAARRDVRDGLVGHRRRADARRPPVPRRARPGRRDRPRAGRPRGRRLPLRQPRLPGDGRLPPALLELLRRSHGERADRPEISSSPSRATPAAGGWSPTPGARSAARSPCSQRPQPRGGRRRRRSRRRGRRPARRHA